MTELSDDRVREATGWRYAYLLVQAGLSLALYVGLAAVLPAGDFSVCAVALGSLVAIQAVADFGVSQSAVAVLPNPATVGPAMPRLVLESGIARLVGAGAAVALAGSCALALAVPASARIAIIAIGPASALAVVVAGVDAVLRAHGRFRRPVVLVGASRLGGLPAIGVAAATGDAETTCVAISAGIFLGSLPALHELWWHWSSADGRPAVRPLLRVAAPLGAANLCILASARLNTILLGATASISSAAVFESAWRVFQVGHYAVGAAATAVAPFVAAGLAGADDRRLALRQRLRRTARATALGGLVLAALIVVLRHPLAEIVAGGSTEPVARSLVILGAVLPVSLLLLLATFTLSASSARDRLWLLAAYAAGAVANLLALVVLAATSPDIAGAGASAIGICLTFAILAPRLAQLLGMVRSG